MSNSFLIKVNGKVKTGGPLAMLQLAHKLRSFGAEVVVCFDDAEAVNLFSDWVASLCEAADVVTLEHLNQYVDSNLFVTETDLHVLESLDWKGNIICYMLSVDNCVSLGLQRLTLEGTLRHWKNIFFAIYANSHRRWSTLTKSVDLFISQSHYAMTVLSRSTAKPVFFVGDYVDHPVRVEKKVGLRHGSKGRLSVCYNPKKGRIYSALARFFSHDVEFIPISGLDKGQLVNLFRRCDAYVDFGSQPGKDRLPREAIACGCPAFIMEMGAGINNSDFPRSRAFRFGILSLLSMSKVVRIGIKCQDSLGLSQKVRQTEVTLEEDEFSLRVEKLITILNES